MKRKYLILFSLSGLILSCDQLSKHIVHANLKYQESYEVLSPLFGITHQRNDSFAFGLLDEAPQSIQDVFFVGIPLFALILILMIFIKLRDNQILTSVALTTILAGAIGNLIDRVQYGYVVDFLNMGMGSFRLPPFNVADCSIVIGVAIMFINTLFHAKLKE